MTLDPSGPELAPICPKCGWQPAAQPCTRCGWSWADRASSGPDVRAGVTRAIQTVEECRKYTSPLFPDNSGRLTFIDVRRVIRALEELRTALTREEKQAGDVEDATGVQVDNRPRPVADAVTGGLKTGEREAATPAFLRPTEGASPVPLPPTEPSEEAILAALPFCPGRWGSNSFVQSKLRDMLAAAYRVDFPPLLLREPSPEQVERWGGKGAKGFNDELVGELYGYIETCETNEAIWRDRALEAEARLVGPAPRDPREPSPTPGHEPAVLLREIVYACDSDLCGDRVEEALDAARLFLGITDPHAAERLGGTAHPKGPDA